MKEISSHLKVIGIIHSPYKTLQDAPFQGSEKISEIKIKKEYLYGLQDLEGFSHLHIFYWLHHSKGYHLIVQTPWDTTPHGLFATRSPHRPNPLGYAVVELIERKGSVLLVKGLDALDGTPIVDIKPYIKKRDAKPDSVSGWAEQIL